MQNVMANFDAILVAEKIPNDLNFIVMGFSQGVSVATRWLAIRAIPCTSLILYAGKVPREFSSEDFKHVSDVQLYIGNQDPYITENIVTA
jgi:predicted esterase